MSNDDDMPELTDEMLTELKQHPVDLHLGPAQVRSAPPNWWIKEYGPKPSGPGTQVLNILVAVLGISAVYLILNVWIWVFTS